MFIRKYEALDMQEALKLVKEDLGPQAVILSSRKIRKGKGTFGLFGRPVIEVTAAVDRNETSSWKTSSLGQSYPRESRQGLESSPRPHQGGPSGLPELDEGNPRQSMGSRPLEEMAAFWEAYQRELSRTEADRPPLETPSQEDGDGAAGNRWHRRSADQSWGGQASLPGDSLRRHAEASLLKQEVAELKETVQFLLGEFMRLGGRALSSELLTLYQRLISQGVEPKLAWSLMEKVQAELARFEGAVALRGPMALRRTLAEMVSTTGPLQIEEGRPKVVAFIGPTGVGKTTTIAKLAAHYALMEKRKVALVTLDTYRIAAVEQLKIYAKLIGIPSEVTLSGEELKTALTSQQDKDLILIDTAGRNQNAEMQMAELKAFFPDRLSMEIQLVISATTKERDLWEIYRKFALVKLSGLIFTKLDESQTFGGILNQVICSGLPLSYLTTGQRVPEDIEVAKGERVADLILRGCNVRSER